VSRTRSLRRRGMSLIEVLVAMAVMAFGLLSVAGLQASLRNNADQSRQRAEAVRMAQVAVESSRTFSVLGVVAGSAAFDTIAAAGPNDVTPANANTTFSVQTIVGDFPAVGDEAFVPRHKRFVASIDWRDRSDQIQTVRIGTIISSTSPELAASLALPGDVSQVQQVGGRNSVIPVNAVDLLDGTSKFSPPGAAPGVNWRFNNLTGFITHKCLVNVCIEFDGRLLSGYVQFATAVAGATSANAEVPPGPALTNGIGETVTVSVAQTSPVVEIVACYQQTFPGYVAYFCAIEAPAPARAWSGRAEVNLPAGLALATGIADVSAVAFRVCRYTIAAARVVPQLVVPALRNEDHPLDYASVTSSLSAQNFLVVRAGSGAAAYDCPADDLLTPYIDGSTWHHQPST
jgi:prepilin-type N-terminal cleavage/methylation domain-containing protein